MTYVDVMICAVPDKNKDEFIEHSNNVIGLFKKHGALSAADFWEDDVPDGKLTSLPLAVKKEVGEVVVYSHIIWPSKKVRNEGMPKAMQDMEASEEAHNMPFDGKRMIFGGFDQIVEG